MKSSISQKILLFFSLLSILVFISFAILIVSFIQNNIVSYILNLGSEVTQKGSNQLGVLLNGYINELRLLSRNQAFYNNDWNLIKNELDHLADKMNPDFEMLFYADTNGDTYTTNKTITNIKDRGYFIDIFVKGKEYSISDPIISRATGAKIFVIAVPIYNNNKEKVGIIATTITLNKLSEIANNIKFGKSGYAFIFDSAGTIIAHPNENFTMQKKIEQLDEEGYKGFKTAFETFKTVDKGLINIVNPQKKKEVVNFAKIPYSNNWKIALSIADEELRSPITKVIQIIVLVSSTAILLTVLVSLVFGRLIARPVKNVSSFFMQMSEGEGDLTKKITHTTKDEVGELSNNFNKFISNLAKMVKSIRNSTDSLSKIGIDLSNQMTENAAAVNEISANAASIKKQIENQTDFINNTKKNVDSILENLEKLNQNIENQSASLIESSSSIEEMVRNIQSTNDILQRNNETVEQMMIGADKGKKGMDDVSDLVKEITTNSEGLMEAVNAIQNIADQINLLAMNAAIEAAHAGESGKGFAVVAEEIRKLAENSNTKGRSITNVLGQLKKSIDQVSEATSNTQKLFESFYELAKIVNQQESIIKNAMEEQSSGSKQILEAIKQISNITSNIKSDSSKMINDSTKIKDVFENLMSVTYEVNKSIEEMSVGLSQINSSISRIQDLSLVNKENISKVAQEMNKFKVE
ncbi:MAG: HAMP domain-containing protein [Spirochaetales bacterium]|jgi:methyl-accepting chemotaxis protein|nr:methyl-accepting chemotaxis protein [Exilispira sp.]NMC66804.1 HAMP domain-containing protein [Spirochaetales bacterium]